MMAAAAEQKRNVLKLKKANYIYMNIKDTIFDRSYTVQCLCSHIFELYIAVQQPFLQEYKTDRTLLPSNDLTTKFPLNRGVERKLVLRFDKNATHLEAVFPCYVCKENTVIVCGRYF